MHKSNRGNSPRANPQQKGPCPVTGGKICHCPQKRAQTAMGSAMLIDMKAAVRKVFTDHTVLTSLIIVESVPTLQPAAEFVAARLLRNPADIGDLIEPIVGKQAAASVEKQFYDHLVLANAALTPVREGRAAAVKQAVNKFYAQGELLASAISALNPNKLKPDFVRKMIREHNQFVVELATLRSQGKYAQFLALYDEYYAHMLMFSDALYEALTP